MDAEPPGRDRIGNGLRADEVFWSHADFEGMHPKYQGIWPNIPVAKGSGMSHDASGASGFDCI